MYIMKKIITFLPLLSLLVIVCSKAPEITLPELPEPTGRVVLAELFTEDG